MLITTNEVHKSIIKALHDTFTSFLSKFINLVIDIKKIAKSFGFENYLFSNNKKSLEKNLKKIVSRKGSFFLEVYVDLTGNKTLPRPKKLLIELKKEFMKKINN